MLRSREVTIWSYYAGAPEMATLLANREVIGEVNFFWYELTADGSIRGSVQNRAGLDKLQQAGIRVLPSIMNGFSAERVHNVVSDPDRRRQHIDDIVALVLENDFDGIDIDYESLDAQDRDDFSLFVEELAAALHGENKLLSIAVHPKTSDEGSWEGPAAQDWARLGAAVDEFKIMTYDYHWSTSDAGPIAPVGWANQVIDYAATVVPPQKTYLGVHFYGYDWLGKNAKSLTWMQVQALIRRYDAQVQRDESNEAWFSYESGGVNTVYFADAQSVEAKLAGVFARHPDLAGIAIWRLGSEDPDNWRVIRVWATGGE
jgi:spore germination protein